MNRIVLAVMDQDGQPWSVMAQQRGTQAGRSRHPSTSASKIEDVADPTFQASIRPASVKPPVG
ncbi:hypothetical protein [Nonomuraea sp. NPDC005692]|uniref:hypothetical protein n=1 Tax=Nonomuraea sp. NPDC005692 TaxID=3157168 RepID=UPI0033C7BAF6